MADTVIANALLDNLRDGGEALDRGARGPSLELALLRDAGLLAVPLPVEAGGRGWGTSAAGSDAVCTLLMALGSASLPIARLYEGHVNAVALIARHAEGAQRERLFDAIREGGLLGVWGADSDRRVTFDDRTARSDLRGTKAFASGLGDVAIAIVTARSSAGLQMVAVTADDPARADHAAWDVDGMVGSRSGAFDCTGLSAASEHRIGGPDALFTEPDFHGGVWRLAACYAGAMIRLAALSAEWLERRDQSDSPLAKARLGAIVIESETAALWSRRAAFSVEGRTTTRRAIGDALFAREAVEQGAVRQLALVERLIGTAMHRNGSEAGRIARDLRFYLRQADLDGKLALATAVWLDDRRAEARDAPSDNQI